MQTPAKLYSDPEICPKDPQPGDMNKYWLVNVRYFDVAAGKWRQRPFKKDINSFKNFKDRLAAATALKEVLAEDLKAGWNPLTGQFPKVDADPLQGINELSEMPFSKAVPFALTKCVAAKRTLDNYRNSSVRIMREVSRVRVGDTVYDFSSIPINKVRKRHVKLLLDHCKKHFKWSNKAFNKHMEYFRALLTRLSKDEIIDSNPARGISYLPEMETQKFLPYTEEEKKAIQEHFFLHHYSFFVYLMIIYQTGMRPNEVLGLKVSDINLQSRVIKIVPDEERDNSKTKNIRLVPIPDTLYLLLREHLSEDIPADFFVFGSAYNKKGFSNHTRGAMNPDYFKPSQVRVKRDTATKYWKKVVIGELKINKHLYAAKHTGADDKILAGITVEALKEMYGHSSKFMTEKYITRLKEIHAQEIRKLAPDFIKKPSIDMPGH